MTQPHSPGYNWSESAGDKPQTEILNFAPAREGAKINFVRGFWIAAGVIVAAWAATAVTIIVLIILGLILRGVGNLGGTGTGFEGVGSETYCSIDPDTETIPDNC